MNAPRPPPSRYWSELASPDFATLDPAATVAVLPLGATEQHGPHLPLGVDTLLADAIVAAALKQLAPALPVLVLPTLPVGLSPEHARFAGTLTLSSATLLALWREIAAGVARAGVRKLLLFNAHGGHGGALEVAAHELRETHGLMVFGASWFRLPLAGVPAIDRFDVHAGQSETAMMLALAPQLVREDQRAHFESSGAQRAADYPILGNGHSVKFGWAMQDLNPAGAAGNAAAATAAQGHALLDAAAKQLALLLAEISRLPLSTLAPDPVRGTGA